jgi:F-type H+-transporting ATPase subunit b
MTSLFLAASAWAAEHGEESHAAAAWMDFMWRVINFALFAGIIWKLAGKRMKEFLAGRREQISSELQDMQSRKVEAEKKLKEVEKSISNLSQERQQILDQAREQGEAMRQSILAKAEEEAGKIREQAKIKASQEMNQAVDALRAEMADTVIESAEKLIVSKLGKKEQEKLIDEYLTKVVIN